MSPKRWREIESIYHAALARPVEEQQTFLSQTCGGDTELRTEVESLLQRTKGSPAETAQSDENRLRREPSDEVEVTADAPHLLQRHRLTHLGKYELKSEIGRGGFGSVYVAWDPVMHRNVAVKVLTSNNDIDVLQRFRNEASSAGKLRHHNIVTIHDFGEQDGVPFIVMELLDGRDLHNWFTRKRQLMLDQKLHILSQTAAGLHHAHLNGVVHRDVKPGNIMVLGDLTVKILDFGIARLTQNTAQRLTQKGNLIGTMSYMSPEQLRGGECDGQSDIFSLGVVAYELLTGQHPFHASDPVAVMFAISTKTPEPLRKLVPELPEALEDVIARALAKDREVRYHAAEDIVLDLEPILREARQRRAVELLAEAQKSLATEDLDAAHTGARAVLEIDPANTVARRLRDTVQQKIQRRAVKPKIDALVAESQDLLAGRKFDSALERIESALRLDRTDPLLQALRDQVRTAQEHAQRAEALLDQARKELREHNLTGAYQNVSAALQTDRENAAASALMDEIRNEIAQRERDRALRDGLTKARTMLMVESFDAASVLLGALEVQYPTSAELQALKSDLQKRKSERERSERLVRSMAAARDLLRDHRFQDAVSTLEGLAAEFPNTAEVSDLLTFARQSEEAERHTRVLAELEQSVESLLAAQDFEGAARKVSEVAASLKSDASIARLEQRIIAVKAAYDREQLIRQIGAEGEELLRQRKFPEAAQILDQALREHGHEAALMEVRGRVERAWSEWKLEQARQAAIAEAQRLLAKEQAAEAIWSIQQVLTAHPADAELTALLTLAQKVLAGQQRTEAVSRLTHDAEALLTAGQLDRAEAAVREGLANFPGESALGSLGARVAEAQKAAARRRALLQIHESVEKLLKTGRFQEAFDQVETAVKQEPHDDLVRLKKDVITQWDQEKLRATLAKAREFLETSKIDEAVELLESAAKNQSQDPDVSALLAYARERKRAAEIRAATEKILLESATLAESGRLEEALSSLEEGCRRYENDSGLTRMRDIVQERLRVAAELKRHQEEQARAEAERRRQEEEKRKHEEAQARAEVERKRQEEEARRKAEAEHKRQEEEKRKAEEARARAEAERKRQEEEARRKAEAEHKRQEEEKRKAEEARARAEAERKRQEEEARRKAEAEHKRKEEEKRKAEEAQARAVAERKRQEDAIRHQRELEDRHISEVLRKAQELHRSRAFADALALLDSTLAQFGHRPALEGLRAQVVAGQTRQAEALELVRQVREALDRDDTTQALDLAIRLDRSHSGEADTAPLHQAIAQKAEQQRIRSAVGALLREAETLRLQKRYHGAIGSIEAGLQRYPGHSDLLTARNRIQLEFETFQQDQLRQAAATELTVLLERARSAAELDLDEIDRRASQLAAEQSGDKKIAKAAKAVRDATAQRRRALAKHHHAEQAAQAMAVASPVGAPIRAPEAPRLSVETVHQPRAASPKRRNLAIAAGVISVIGAGVLTWRLAAPGVKPLQVEADAGTTITVAGRTCTTLPCSFNLQKGKFEIRAERPGYRGASRTVEIGSKSPTPVRFFLTPLPSRLMVSTNFASGDVLLDGARAGALRNGEFDLEAVSTGTHELDVRSPDGRAALRFEIAAGVPPKLVSSPSMMDTQGIVVSGYASGAELRCDCASGEVAIDGRTAGHLENGRFSVAALAPGTHQFRVTAPDGVRDSVIALQNDPSLNLVLAADRNIGTLVVETGQDNVRVYLDNRVQNVVTRQGLVRLPLAVKVYSVRVEKPGYRKPPAQVAEVEKGAIKRITFTLVPTDSTLIVREAQPGVRVLVDGQAVGVTGADGTFRASTAPGSHSIDLQKDGFTPRHLTRDFQPGAPVNLSRADAELAEVVRPPTPPPAAPTPAKAVPVPPLPAPDPRAVEAEEWERVRNSRSVDQIAEFLRKYPNSANSEQASRRIEQLDWESAQNSRDAAPLEAFLRKYPNSANAAQVRQRLEELDWASVNRQDAAALRGFLQRHPSGPLATQGNADLAALQQKSALAADRGAIGQALAQYANSYNRRNLQELQAVWPSLSGGTLEAIRQAFRNARAISLELSPVRDPEISGDTAMVQVRRTLQQTFERQPLVNRDTVIITLKNTGRGWIILDVK
jgi:serine/threonine-protein kinase